MPLLATELLEKELRRGDSQISAVQEDRQHREVSWIGRTTRTAQPEATTKKQELFLTVLAAMRFPKTIAAAPSEGHEATNASRNIKTPTQSHGCYRVTVALLLRDGQFAN